MATASARAALDGVRVIDLGRNPDSAFAGRLLIQLGADVVKVEPPGGDALRSSAPLLGRSEEPAGLGWEHFAAGSRSVVLDPSVETDVATLRSLLLGADVVLETGAPGELAAHGLAYDDLRALAPGLVWCSVTPFGVEGPRASWLGSDLTSYAAGGMMNLTGEPDGPPLRMSSAAADHLAGLYAAVGILVALDHRLRTGRGQRVDLSAQEAVASTLVDVGATYFQLNDRLNPTRVGGMHPTVVPLFIAPAADGYVHFSGLEPHMFRNVLAWASSKGVDMSMFDDPEYDAPMNRLALRDLLHLLIEQATTTVTKAEFYEQLQARGVPSAPVSDLTDLVANEQLAARGFFSTVELPDGSTATEAGPPMSMSGSPMVRPSAAPRLDADREEILASTGDRPAVAADHIVRRGTPWGTPRALSGLRVLDLSWALAGPWAGRMLATEGAEVIRVESAKRLDGLRRMASHPERAGAFINANCGKASVSIDIGTDEGRDLVRRLAAESDVVLENFRPGVLARAGLAYDDLRQVNPELIMCSMPSQGSTGPHHDYVAYAPNLNSLAGFTHLTGFPDQKPSAICSGFIDQLASGHAVLGILAALRHRDLTGEGQYVEVSQFEAAVGMLGPLVLDATANGSAPTRRGNRDATMAPHAVYPSAGDDRWVAIAVATDEQWRRLAPLVGRPQWADELAAVESRREHQAEIDAAIAVWTRQRPPAEAMAQLQGAGVPAAAVQNTGELLEDDVHLRARGYYETVVHPAVGELRVDRAAYRLDATPNSLCGRAAPLLGQHNEEVLSAVLGLDGDTIERLAAEGVLDAHLIPPVPVTT